MKLPLTARFLKLLLYLILDETYMHSRMASRPKSNDCTIEHVKGPDNIEHSNSCWWLVP